LDLPDDCPEKYSPCALPWVRSRRLSLKNNRLTSYPSLLQFLLDSSSNHELGNCRRLETKCEGDLHLSFMRASLPVEDFRLSAISPISSAPQSIHSTRGARLLHVDVYAYTPTEGSMSRHPLCFALKTTGLRHRERP
jgi:hypothetical protein